MDQELSWLRVALDFETICIDREIIRPTTQHPPFLQEDRRGDP